MQSVIKLRVSWRVGDGNSIRVMVDPWLERGLILKDDVVDMERVANLTVVELIEGESRKWKEEFIREMFNPITAEEILKIPLSKREVSDCLWWKGDVRGEFTIRSTYKMLTHDHKGGRWCGDR